MTDSYKKSVYKLFKDGKRQTKPATPAGSKNGLPNDEPLDLNDGDCTPGWLAAYNAGTMLADMAWKNR